MTTWSVVLGVSFLVMGLIPSEVGPAYTNNQFLPETDNGTPDCVQDPRDTFCINPEKYPKERILYLLENKMFDIDSLLTDESRDSYVFEARNVPPAPMYGYDSLRQPYQPPRQTYEQPRQTYSKPPRTSYGPPPPPSPSNSYLPPRQSNFSTTSKPYHPPPPPLAIPPPSKYNPSHHTYSSPSSYGASSYHYGTPAPPYDNDGPYPRYRKTTTPSSSYLTRYLPPPTPPRSPPKPQPRWRKIMRSSRRRQKRQIGTLELCPYDEDYIMPRAALNNQGKWMFLVNVQEESAKYTQAVQTKKCIPGSSCSDTCNVPDGFVARCQQQYAQKRLIALNGSGATLNSDIFWFPTCCLCKIFPKE